MDYIKGLFGWVAWHVTMKVAPTTAARQSEKGKRANIRGCNLFVVNGGKNSNN